MNAYADEITAILAPKIGYAMAESALRVQCRKFGMTPETIGVENIGPLADSLFVPLKIFAGDGFARTMVAQIKRIA